ncbi:MAG TPA: hypothetical protein VFN82_01850, partial [Solirubrobacterales bacterium]|nr:hypothetical protein [Solirubrobacterales bacterium]
EDSVVPISTSQAFAAELPRWVSFFEVPRADHTEAWNVDPALYDQRLISFLRRIHAATRLRSDAADKATSGSGA